MRKTKRVLILDDHPIHRELLADEFEDMGWKVAAVADIDSAKTTLEGFTPSLLIFDVVMAGEKRPVIEFVKSLRNSKRHQETPVLFVTAYQNQEIAELIKGIPRATILDKPFDFEDLLSRVRSLAAT